jgi:hypothetical protein
MTREQVSLLINSSIHHQNPYSLLGYAPETSGFVVSEITRSAGRHIGCRVFRISMLRSSSSAY